LQQLVNIIHSPWTPGAWNLTIPDVNPQRPLYDENSVCYAGKEYIEFSASDSLMVTYVFNSREDIEDETSFIRRNMFLYRPVVIQAPCCR
jgi:hypothetical protein